MVSIWSVEYIVPGPLCLQYPFAALALQVSRVQDMVVALESERAAAGCPWTTGGPGRLALQIVGMEVGFGQWGHL